MSEHYILEDFPDLEKENFMAVHTFAADMARNRFPEFSTCSTSNAQRYLRASRDAGAVSLLSGGGSLFACADLRQALQQQRG
jgi:hypothetical protein